MALLNWKTKKYLILRTTSNYTSQLKTEAIMGKFLGYNQVKD